MHINKRIGTQTKNINLYHFINIEADGTTDDDGYMRHSTEIHGRHSIGVVWNGFEGLLTFGFRCEPKAVRSDLDFTAAWKKKNDRQFSSAQHRIVSEIRRPTWKATNPN